jgi:SAUR family protein
MRLSFFHTQYRDSFVPVFVGNERKKFMVATGHMNHPLIVVLLETSAEEMGFEQSGALRVACEEVSFQRLLCLIEREAFHE